MLGDVAVSGCLLAALLPAAVAQAQGFKPWRQAMIIPKADAGFFLMAANAVSRSARGSRSMCSRSRMTRSA